MKKAVLSFLFALSALAAFAQTYKIGDNGPGGGIVFYYSEEGFSVRGKSGTEFYYSEEEFSVSGENGICHYLECAPDELGSMRWSPYDNYNAHTKNSIGAGKINTDHIVGNRYVYTLSEYAAKVCLKYSTSTTKEGDWYLPSKDELNLIYKNLVKPGIIKGDDYYWSSSQYDDAAAWQQNFNDGDRNNYDKDDDVCVRAVRAF